MPTNKREPNLQNIPIRTETGRQVRKAFVDESRYKLLNVDYSQIEARIMENHERSSVRKI